MCTEISSRMLFFFCNKNVICQLYNVIDMWSQVFNTKVTFEYMYM